MQVRGAQGCGDGRGPAAQGCVTVEKAAGCPLCAPPVWAFPSSCFPAKSFGFLIYKLKYPLRCNLNLAAEVLVKLQLNVSVAGPAEMVMCWEPGAMLC